MFSDPELQRLRAVCCQLDTWGVPFHGLQVPDLRSGGHFIFAGYRVLVGLTWLSLWLLNGRLLISYNQNTDQILPRQATGGLPVHQLRSVYE